MADPNTRQGKRTPVTLKIKFKSETLEQFIERYAVDVSQGGIFIRTKEPLAVGTQMKFEFQLRDASPLIAGEGTVVWTRENDPSRPAIAPGMGVRFDRLADGSQGILERILTEKAKQAPQRPTNDSTKPPLFTDTPTRVAPPPMQEALLGRRAGDSLTPLPRPMPFHSDADEFPDEAFEEATKVRALDELIAQTAESSDEAPTTRRVPEPKPQAELIEGPDLPSAPEARSPKLLDTSPSPRIELPVAVAMDGSAAKKTVLGVEAPPRGRISTPPAGQAALEAPPLSPSGVRAVAAESTEPARMPKAQGGSKAPLLILLLLLVAAAGAAVWFLVIRPRQQAEEAPVMVQPDQGSAGSAGSAASAGSDVGSAGSGSAVAAVGSAAPPTMPTVETVIASSVEGASVEIAGTDQKGDAPFTAKLEKDKTYQAKVTAKGFVAQDLTIKGGDAQQTAKLVAKPRVIAVDSEPSGALIFVDSAASGHTTPFEVELSAAQAAKKTVRIQLRKSGFKSIEKVVELAKLTEDDAKLSTKISEKLSTAPVAPPTPRPQPPQPTNGSNAGSDAPPPPPPTEGSAAPPHDPASQPVTSPSGGSSAEPEPGFTKPTP